MKAMTLLGSAAAVGLAMLGVPGVAAGAPPAGASQRPLEYTVTVKGDVEPGVVGSSADHFMSFSAPIEIPGVGLPAGTYLFRFLTPSMVQVTSPDRSKVYAMFFTTPASRSDAGDQAEMIFEREHAAAPPRIAKWSFPNGFDGVAPVYPEG